MRQKNNFDISSPEPTHQLHYTTMSQGSFDHHITIFSPQGHLYQIGESFSSEFASSLTEGLSFKFRVCHESCD